MSNRTPLLLLLALCAGASAAQSWDGSRTVPVHRLPVFDEDGSRIIPIGKNCAPLSQRQSCNACHDYKTIAQGWHFNAGATDRNGRAGEPWVLQDPITGTQLPLSWRGGKGVWKPDQVGMDAWRFTKEFGRSLPGGGVSDPSDLFAPGARWNVSGPLEINCLACHNQTALQDPSEWARQVWRENYRWAPTAASGLGEVGGMAARMREMWTPDRRPNLDDNVFAVPPSVEYAAGAFDSKNRMVFDLGRPKDRNCLACHSVGHHGKERTGIAGDIHTRAGLSCVDCHRNGMDHRITRGYEGESKDREQASATAMSCRGCHLGSDASAGRFGAQRPAHRGLPPVHLDKLSCTACHSGNAPAGSGPELVRTSRAHRLGIHGRAIWDTELPLIQEPVFAPGHDGKIAPHRALWPAFWARVEGDQLKPLLPEAVMALAGDAMCPSQAIAQVLTMIAGLPDAPGAAVLGLGDQALKIRTDLELETVAAKGAPAGKPQWGFLVEGRFVPLIPVVGRWGFDLDGTFVPAGSFDKDPIKDSTKESTEALLKVLIGAGVKDPVITLGGECYRINPADAKLAVTKAPELTPPATTPTIGRFDQGRIVPAGWWGFEVDGRFVAADKVTRDTVVSDRIETLLKVLTNAGVKDPVITLGADFFRINPVDAGIIKAAALVETPAVGRFAKGAVVPLVADLEAAVGSSLTTAGKLTTVEPAQITRVLKAMAAKEASAAFAYVANGRVHRLGADGTLGNAPHAQAAPALWPLGHDVRPAQQALGAKGCTECHSMGAPFFAAPVTPNGPLAGTPPAQAMVAYAGLDGGFAQVFSLSFLARPLFKCFLFAAAAGMLVSLLLAGARSRMPLAPVTGATCGARLLRSAVMVAVASVVALALTGFVPFLTGGALSGWMLMLHNALGGAFAAALAAMACLGLCLQTASCRQSRWRWLMVATGAAAILSAVTMMIPWQGTEGLHTLVVLHRIAAALAVVAGVVTVLSGGKPQSA